MKRVIDDPDFGPHEVPPPPDREEFEKVAQGALAAMRTRRIWPAGSVSRCPNCGKNALVGRDDLTCRFARPGGVVVFHRLRGARCESCKEQSLEPGDLIAVERDAGVEVAGDFEIKVTTIGSGTLGTYWTKDLVRNLRLTAGKKAYVQLLDRDTALLRFSRDPGVLRGQPKRKKRTRAKADAK